MQFHYTIIFIARHDDVLDKVLASIAILLQCYMCIKYCKTYAIQAIL
jgi:hypothetical protein